MTTRNTESHLLRERTACSFSGRPASARRALGFTLVEMMAVVTVIGLAASLAAPGVTQQLRDRRVREAAQRVAQVYSDARTRALGRGSAVLVRFENGVYTVMEAQRGTLETNAACAALPVSNCTTTRWDEASLQQFRNLPGLNLALRSEYGTGDSASSVTMQADNGDSLALLEICFTPLGRTFAREAAGPTVPLLALTAPYLAEIARPGFDTRRVLVMPNGVARVTERVTPP